MKDTLNRVITSNNGLEDTVETLQQEHAELIDKCNGMETENNRLRSDLVKNQIVTNDLEQNSRKYNLVFRNVHVDEKTDVKACMEKVLLIIKSIDIENITENDFAACHVFKNKNGGHSIIAKLLNVHNVELIYKSKRNTKQMTDPIRERLGVPSGKNVIILPNLTKTNQLLLSQTFEHLKDGLGWKFVWADTRGIVRARKAEGSDAVIIKNTMDIVKHAKIEELRGIDMILC